MEKAENGQTATLSEESHAYIYSLSDPDTGVIRYVGKTNNLRRRIYLHTRSMKVEPNKERNQWLADLARRGLRPLIAVLACVSEDTWRTAEQGWIAALRMSGAPLLNQKPGGEGPEPGWKPTPSQISQLSASLKAHYAACPESRQRIVRINKERQHSEEENRALHERHTAWLSTVSDDEKRRKLHPAGYEESSARQRGRKHGPSKSRFVGVIWDNASSKWRAVIGWQGKRIRLGMFADELEAAKAYNMAALAYYGESARLNMGLEKEGRTSNSHD